MFRVGDIVEVMIEHWVGRRDGRVVYVTASGHADVFIGYPTSDDPYNGHVYRWLDPSDLRVVTRELIGGELTAGGADEYELAMKGMELINSLDSLDLAKMSE